MNSLSISESDKEELRSAPESAVLPCGLFDLGGILTLLGLLSIDTSAIATSPGWFTIGIRIPYAGNQSLTVVCCPVLWTTGSGGKTDTSRHRRVSHPNITWITCHQHQNSTDRKSKTHRRVLHFPGDGWAEGGGRHPLPLAHRPSQHHLDNFLSAL